MTKQITSRDRMQIAAFHAFFRCELLINKEPPEIAFAYAIAKSSDIVFDKLPEDSLKEWLKFKGQEEGENN